jgi:PIN domain nuclease of toxin-antitoxin system
MKFLLDTHIFLWFISGDTRLPAGWRDIIRDAGNDVYLSVVSLWEAIIKYHLGKLPLPESAESYLPTQRMRHQIPVCLSMRPVYVDSLPFRLFTVTRLIECWCVRPWNTI